MLGRPEDADDMVKTGQGGGNISPRDAGSFSNRDSSYTSGQGDLNDLGATGTADSASAAAVAAMRATPRFPSPLNRDPVLHLLRRCTFGPTQADVAAVKELGIDGWLDQQLEPDKIADPVADAALKTTPTVTMTTAQIRAAVKDGDNKAMYELTRAVIARQIWSTRQLYEVMVDFWNNHLNITSPFDGGWDTRVPYDVNVIRKHALGKFSDMLIASARDPAMMRYLDNTSSDKRNVNENYGRELLELHTVGIDGGYNEKDVRNSAYLMTGRTATREGMFKYEQNRHWTGAVKVLGFQHANKSAKDGLAVGDAYLLYLATHLSTAKYVARNRGALRVRHAAAVPGRPARDRVPAERLGDRPGAQGAVPVPGVLDRGRAEDPPPLGELRGHRPGRRHQARRGHRQGPGGPVQLHAQARPGAAGLGPAGRLPGRRERLELRGRHAGDLELAPRLPAAVVQGPQQPARRLLVTQPAATMATYLDVLCNRLIFQPMQPAERDALIKFLGAKPDTRVTDANLGGKLPNLAPLVLDSVYHALR